MAGLYTNLPFKSFDEWFTDLAAIAAKSEDISSLPKLELILKKGGIARGHILKEDKVNKHKFLMIASLSDGYQKSEITFIPARLVIGLTLLEPDLYLKQYILPAASKAIGGLELKRAAKNTNEQLAKISEGKVNLSADVDNCPETARWELLQILEMFPDLWEKLTADKLGREAIYEGVDSVTLAISKEFKASLNQKTLKIEVSSPFQKSIAEEKERLQRAIEDLF